MKLDTVLRAFKHKNYRLFFCGQCFSVIGTWIQSIALSWMVYRITGSALLLGVTGFCSQIPSLILAPFTGVAADSFDRRKILICTQSCAMVQAFGMAFIAFSGNPQVWQIISLALMIGVVNSFDTPARQSFVIELVGNKADLPNAIALNSSMFNAARLIGPSISGIFIAAVGEGYCFLINAFSYIAVISSLILIRTSKTNKIKNKKRASFREALRYVYNFVPIRYVILLLAGASLLGMPYAVLMPAYIRESLGGGPRTLGFVMSASGVGALSAAIRLAARNKAEGLERNIPFMGLCFGCGLICFSFSHVFILSAMSIAVASFGMVSVLASSNTLIQTLVDDDKRGRVMSLYAVAFMGTAPFGSLLAGWCAKNTGAANAIMLSGIFMCVLAVLFSLKVKDISLITNKIYKAEREAVAASIHEEIV